jgi:hypothetical protein
MLCDGIGQQNHVDVVVKRLFLRKPSALLFHPRDAHKMVNATIGDGGSGQSETSLARSTKPQVQSARVRGQSVNSIMRMLRVLR